MTRKTGLVLASLVALMLVVAGGLTYAGDSCGSSCSSKKAKNASTTTAQTKAGSTCSSTCSASSASASKSDPACAAVCGTANASSAAAPTQAVTASGSSCSAHGVTTTTAGGACCASKGASATMSSAGGCSMKCDASKSKAGCTGMTMNKGVFDANVYKVENGTKYAVADGKKFVVSESTPSMTVGNARFYFADASCAVSCSEMMKASAPKYTHEAAAMASVEHNVKVEGDKKLATCEMSGNTFEITASTPTICKDGEKVYFCGEGCCNSYMGI